MVSTIIFELSTEQRTVVNNVINHFTKCYFCNNPILVEIDRYIYSYAKMLCHENPYISDESLFNLLTKKFISRPFF